jgi:hypothetical protein
MSNVNNWEFAKHLQQFKLKILDSQIAKVDKAKKIMDDPKYPWKDDAQKNTAKATLEGYKAWLNFYQEFYKQGMMITEQHEGLVNLLAKWYANWYDNISNEGRQEAEIMKAQADMLQEIFCEIYEELVPLKLDIKPPKALNL